MIACLQCGTEMVAVEGYNDATVYLCPQDGQVDDAPTQIARLVFTHIAETLEGARITGILFEQRPLEGEDAYPPDLPAVAIRLYEVTITHRTPGAQPNGSLTVFVAQHADGWHLYDDDFDICEACGEFASTQDGRIFCRDCGPLDVFGHPVQDILALPEGVEA